MKGTCMEKILGRRDIWMGVAYSEFMDWEPMI
jgi:hypothetical protein